jgi:hypothetical protein
MRLVASEDLPAVREPYRGEDLETETFSGRRLEAEAFRTSVVEPSL